MISIGLKPLTRREIVEVARNGVQVELSAAARERICKSRGVVDKYVKDPELRAKVHRLDKEGKGADPSFMKGDFVFNRWLRMWHTKLRHFKLFKTYYK